LETAKTKISASILLPLIFPLLLWVIFFISELGNINLFGFGVLPRHFSGLLGILTSPLIHGDFSHLFSNTIPLIILGAGVFYFYPHAAYKALAIIYLMSNTLVWLFAREVCHIGASGIVYGFVAFFFFSGVFRRDNKSIALALLVTILYGSLIWGIFPGSQGISWESHFFGAISGIISAFVLRKIDPSKKYEWEDETLDENEKPEISYDKELNDF
jgi:membrane associated rhomboid family serine protease